MPQFLDSKIPQEFEKVARGNIPEAKNALLLAMGSVLPEKISPKPSLQMQKLAKNLVNLRNGFLVAHDENYFYAEMYIKTFLK
jgi:hypothetical protein